MTTSCSFRSVNIPCDKTYFAILITLHSFFSAISILIKWLNSYIKKSWFTAACLCLFFIPSGNLEEIEGQSILMIYVHCSLSYFYPQDFMQCDSWLIFFCTDIIFQNRLYSLLLCIYHTTVLTDSQNIFLTLWVRYLFRMLTFQFLFSLWFQPVCWIYRNGKVISGH